MKTSLFAALAAALFFGTEAISQEMAPPPPAVDYGGYEAPSRVSLIYSPEIPLTNGKLSYPETEHNIGIEFSTPTGFASRYHVQIDFVTVPGANGVRLEPLTFGWAVPLVHTRDVSFEFEPLLSLADGTLFFSTNDNVLGLTPNPTNILFTLSSGIAAQFNLGLGPLYLFLSPVGLELRYLSIDGNGNVAAGGALDYRFRGGIGVQY